MATLEQRLQEFDQLILSRNFSAAQAKLNQAISEFGLNRQESYANMAQYLNTDPRFSFIQRENGRPLTATDLANANFSAPATNQQATTTNYGGPGVNQMMYEGLFDQGQNFAQIMASRFPQGLNSDLARGEYLYSLGFELNNLSPELRKAFTDGVNSSNRFTATPSDIAAANQTFSNPQQLDALRQQDYQRQMDELMASISGSPATNQQQISQKAIDTVTSGGLGALNQMVLGQSRTNQAGIDPQATELLNRFDSAMMSRDFPQAASLLSQAANQYGNETYTNIANYLNTDPKYDWLRKEVGGALYTPQNLQSFLSSTQATPDNGLLTGAANNQPRSSAPTGRIESDKAAYLEQQLKDQYNAINQNAGYEYGGKKSDLDRFFKAQASKLAANGIGDLADIGEKDGFLINKVTGENIKKITFSGDSWLEPNSTSFQVGEDIQLEDRGSFQRWGKDVSVDGQADYGINFVDGQAVMVPIWKDTATDLGPLATIAAIGLSLAFPGAGAAVGAYLAPTASAAVQAAIGSAALSGVTTGVITGDLEKAALAAALAGGGSYLQASGSLGEVFDSVGLTEYKDTFGISGGVQTTAQAATQDAIQLATQGLSENQISSILQQQYGLDPTQALNIGKNAFDVAFAAQDAQSLFNITGSADAVKQNLIASGIDTNLAENLATSVAMGGPGANLSSVITDAITSDPNLFSKITTGTDGLFTGTATDLANAGITTGGQGINLTQDQLAKIISGTVPGSTFAEQVINAGGSIGAGAAAGGLLDGVTDQTKDVINQLTGGNKFDLGGLLTNLAGAGIDYAALQEIANQASALGRSAEARAVAAGEAANVPFTPYTVTTGAGTTAFGTGAGGQPTATVTASPEYEALRQQALGQAGATLGAINPANAAQSLFNRAEALAAPARQRETEQLLSNLGARGLLGVSRNLPTVGGTTAGVNPYLESLLSAQQTAQAQTALQAEQFGTQEAQRQANLANTFIGTGQGIDTRALETLTQGRLLGGDVLAAEQTNAQRLLDATLKGQALRLGYENVGLDARRQGILGLAGIGQGLLGNPTQPGNTASQNILGGLFTELFK